MPELDNGDVITLSQQCFADREAAVEIKRPASLNLHNDTIALFRPFEPESFIFTKERDMVSKLRRYRYHAA